MTYMDFTSVIHKKNTRYENSIKYIRISIKDKSVYILRLYNELANVNLSSVIAIRLAMMSTYFT